MNCHDICDLLWGGSTERRDREEAEKPKSLLVHLAKGHILSTSLQIWSAALKKNDGRKNCLNPWVNREPILQLKTGKGKKSNIHPSFPKRILTHGK